MIGETFKGFSMSQEQKVCSGTVNFFQLGFRLFFTTCTQKHTSHLFNHRRPLMSGCRGNYDNFAHESCKNMNKNLYLCSVNQLPFPIFSFFKNLQEWIRLPKCILEKNPFSQQVFLKKTKFNVYGGNRFVHLS